MATRDCIDYFWVEDFRGIKNTGFHLTRKYNYKFDKEKWILEREENPDYLDDFYGDDPEVCAIVGNNGVGKTSILNALFYSFSQKIPDVAKKVVIAFRSGNVYLVYPGVLGEDFHTFFYHNKMENSKAVLYTNKEETAPFEKMICLLHSGVVDFNSLDQRLISEADDDETHNAINISTGALIESSVQYMLENENNSDPVKRFFYKDFLDQINLMSSDEAKFIEWLTRPARVKIRVKTRKEICSELAKVGYYKYKTPEIWGFFEIDYTSAMTQFQSQLLPCLAVYFLRAMAEKLKKKYKVTEPADLLYILRMALTLGLNGKEKLDNSSFAYLLDKTRRFNPNNDEYRNEEIIRWKEKYYKINPSAKISDELITAILNSYLDCSLEANTILNLLSSITIKGKDNDNTEDKDVFNVYLRDEDFEDDDRLNLDINRLIQSDITYNIIDSIMDFSWDLSSGEFEQLSLFARIYSHWLNEYLTRDDSNNPEVDEPEPNDFLLILLDEADMLLHPEWQREYVANVVSFCKKLYKDKTVQIVIATHSPIMLSDIPRQNTLFLKKDKESGEVYSVDGSDTFASNIYGLFRESFFIEGGMIGKYAEKKLEELADDILSYSGDESKRESIEKRISMIGDAFIRKNYRELFEKEWPSSRVDKLENIDQLKKRIAELEAQIAKDNNSESESKK